MRKNWGRLVRHVAITGVSLGAIGYVLARAFLFTHQMYGGAAYNPENERVLWQTPIVMAAIGMALTAALDLVFLSVRRSTPLPAPETPPTT